MFTFYPNNDYNLKVLKISLFLLAFSLYFTMNAFFFSDNTMHDIYKDESTNNILSQIPIILYSTAICGIMNSILKLLSLSEKDILSLSQQTDYKNAVEKSKKILKYLRIKFFFFFLLNFIILLFCWYFISTFCAVYQNTQIILMNDSFLSFSLSMIYPFGLNLFPGIFRIPSLRTKNKNRECLYKFSYILSLI